MTSLKKIKNISINDIVKLLIIVLLGLTFLFNIGEAWMLMTHRHIPNAPKQLHTPIYIKLIKDAFFILIISLGLFKMLFQQSLIKEKYYYLFFLSVAVSFFLSVFNQDIFLTLAGGKVSYAFIAISCSLPCR